MNNQYTILIDNREKTPLLFPDYITVLDPSYMPISGRSRTIKLLTQSLRLPTGDYLLADANPAASAVVERKGSLKEVAHNTLLPKRRKLFIAELERMAPWRRKILFLEGSPLRLLSDEENAIGADGLQRLLREYGVELALVPDGGFGTISQRRAAGEWVARLLINESLYHEVDYSSESPSDSC